MSDGLWIATAELLRRLQAELRAGGESKANTSLLRLARRAPAKARALQIAEPARTQRLMEEVAELVHQLSGRQADRPMLVVGADGRAEFNGWPVDTSRVRKRAVQTLRAVYDAPAGHGVPPEQAAEAKTTDTHRPAVEYMSRWRKAMRTAISEHRPSPVQRDRLLAWIDRLGRYRNGLLYLGVPRADVRFVDHVREA